MAALTEIMEEPQTEVKLRELRDSEDAVDRSTFWRIAGKRVPTMVEANLNGDVMLRVVDRSDGRKD